MKKYSKIFLILQSAKLLEVSREGYYAWLKKKKSKTTLKHEYLTKEIHRGFYEHDQNYGSPRIALQLYNEGIKTNKRIVAIIMRKEGLLAKGFKRRINNYGKTKLIEDYIKENILKREFHQEIIDKIWVTDITYITCKDGRLYLATYIDLTTRIPRCYSLEERMKKELILSPLISYKGNLPKIIHSDRGTQYRSLLFQEFCQKNEIIHSMSAPRTPVDNAIIESFHKSIKRELIYANKNKRKVEMKVLIQNYIEKYYTQKRIHTKLKKTLCENEKKLINSFVENKF